jgi:hypothetical protein
MTQWSSSRGSLHGVIAIVTGIGPKKRVFTGKFPTLAVLPTVDGVDAR